VCVASGDLPNADCPRRTLTWFIPGKSPIRVSTVHRRIRIDLRTGRQACADAPAATTREEVYEFWPSDLSALFARAGMPRRRPPPPGECADGGALLAARPQIRSPVTGAVYELRVSHPTASPIGLAATADGDVQMLYWFADANFLGAAPPNTTLPWTPARAGEFALSVVDDHGASDTRTVRVGMVP